ncbi:MAG: hypothetical protein HC802_20225 [Caldilineaceae bacterium]|nr:hypothetical protein [Caldilineaceae bacterium]
MTRPNTLTTKAPIVDLAEGVRTFADLFQIAESGRQVTELLLDLVTTFTVAGKQIHDANGLNRLLTHNMRDFDRYSGLITVIPLVPEIESQEE